MTTTNFGKLTGTGYKLGFPLLPGQTSIRSNEPLTLNIFGTVLPSVALDQAETRWQGSKMFFHSGSVTFETWNINFVVDSSMSNWMILYTWLTYINNNVDTIEADLNHYMVDATLTVVDNYEQTVRKILFKNMWIQTLGEISLSQREGENNLESSATLYYDRYEFIE